MERVIIFMVLISLSLSNRIFSKDFVDSLRQRATFKIKDPNKNKFRDWTIEEIKGLLYNEDGYVPRDTKHSSHLRKETSKKMLDFLKKNPSNAFDWRELYPNCDATIHDLGNCGGSYAHSSVMSFQHRNCQAYGHNIRLSYQDPLSCCEFIKGCTSGTVEDVYSYFLSTGVVEEDCFPFSSSSGEVEECITTCKNQGEWKKYMMKFERKLDSFLLVMEELVSNGPVTLVIDVYEDFLHYESGVYKHTEGEYLGKLALDVIGYSATSTTNTLQCLNQWGIEWGDNGEVVIDWNESQVNPYGYCGYIGY